MNLRKGQRLAIADMLGWVTPKGTPVTNVVVRIPRYEGRDTHALVHVTDPRSTMRGYDLAVHVDNLVARSVTADR